MRYARAIAMVALAVYGHCAAAVPIRTAFEGVLSISGGIVDGFLQYDLDQGTLESMALGITSAYEFVGGSALFIANRQDGSTFTGRTFTYQFGNDLTFGSVACDGAYDFLRFDGYYVDSLLGGSLSHLHFSVYDCSASMFAPSVLTLPQINIPLSIPVPTDHTALFQFDEELVGSLGGFRVTNLMPLPPLHVPEPGSFALLFAGLVVVLRARASAVFRAPPASKTPRWFDGRVAFV